MEEYSQIQVAEQELRCRSYCKGKGYAEDETEPPTPGLVVQAGAPADGIKTGGREGLNC